MVKPRTTTRRSALVACAVAMLLAPFVAWQGAQGGEQDSVSALAPRGIVVVGDSITARYNGDSGSTDEGWWHIVGDHFGADVQTFAQSGSGYLRQGLECTGNRFVDRSQAYAERSPSILLVEGGRNDWAKCVDGTYVWSTDAEVRHAVDTYFDVLQTYLPRTTRIIVLGPPWGPLDQTNGRRITAIVRAEAASHHFQFISTAGALTAAHVVDGVHPNQAGSAAIARRVINALD